MSSRWLGVRGLLSLSAAISSPQHDYVAVLLRSHSTKEMTRPVRPPTLLSAFLALDPALDKTDPPELVTLDRPSDAFDVMLDVASLALEAVSEAVSFALFAVSAVVEACLTFCRRRRNRDWRSNALEAGAVDMATTAPMGFCARPMELWNYLWPSAQYLRRLEKSLGVARSPC